MIQRRSQVVRGASGRFRSARPGERTVRATKSRSTGTKADGSAGRAIRTAPVRGAAGVRVVRVSRARPAASARPARGGSRTRVAAPRKRAAATTTHARRAAPARAARKAPLKTRSAAPRRRPAKRAARRARPAPYAVKLLHQDHRALLEGAAQFQKAMPEEKRQVAERLCRLLALHTQIEEELLYPQAHEAFGSDSLRIATAQIEHAVMRDLVSQIEDMDEVDELYEAKMQVLTELMRAHIHEEETEIFPRLERTSVDLNAMGEQLARRKQELSGDEELVIAYEYEEDEPAAGRAPRARPGMKGGRHVLIHSGRR